MKKFILLIALTLSVFAQKPYMLIVVQEGCPACIEARSMIQDDKELRDTLHNYTDLKIMSRAQAEQLGFAVNVTPSFYLFAKEERILLAHPVEGVPHSARDLSAYIKDIYKKYNDYLENQENIKKESL